MSNQYFRFKQFTIHQDKCAMKVSTDACILGAWAKPKPNTKRILDVGTGTGLLALMLAQKTDAVIDAIELDAAAAEQAKENMAWSNWAERINIINADVVGYELEHKYDLIITNPPFFNNSLLGNTPQRNQARHTDTLSYQQLLDVMVAHLTDGGEAVILLPVDEFRIWEQLLVANNWQVVTKLSVYPKAGQAANRVVAICKPGIGTSADTEDLYIRNDKNIYTEAFSKLMHPYYLDTGLL